MSQVNHVRTVIVPVVDDGIGRVSRRHVVVQDPGEHSQPTTDIQMHNFAAGRVEAQLLEGGGQRVTMIIIVPVVLTLLDNEFAIVVDYPLTENRVD